MAPIIAYRDGDLAWVSATLCGPWRGSWEVLNAVDLYRAPGRGHARFGQRCPCLS